MSTAGVARPVTREFDRQFPGFETEIHGVRIEEGSHGKRYMIDCVRE